MTAPELGPEEGIPEDPGAWLMTAAKRRAIDSPKHPRQHRDCWHTDCPSFQLRELALPLPLPTAHYQLLGLVLSRSDLALFGLSWLSGH